MPRLSTGNIGPGVLFGRHPCNCCQRGSLDTKKRVAQVPTLDVVREFVITKSTLGTNDHYPRVLGTVGTTGLTDNNRWFQFRYLKESVTGLHQPDTF